MICRQFWAWLCLTNTPKLSESKYKAGFGVIIWGQNPQSFMMPIYSTTVLYDDILLQQLQSNISIVLSGWNFVLNGLSPKGGIVKEEKHSSLNCIEPIKWKLSLKAHGHEN